MTCTHPIWRIVSHSGSEPPYTIVERCLGCLERRERAVERPMTYMEMRTQLAMWAVKRAEGLVDDG